MKNLKKVIFALMVVFLVVGFIGCKTESDPPKAPVVTNNFKGNVFVAEYSEESDSGIWGYIEFIDDTNGKMGISNYDEESNPIITDQPFTYSVTDDVATIKATMYGREVTVTTSKLTDGIFTFSTEYKDSTVLVTCTKGDKSLFDVWTVYYDEEEVMKDFFYEFEDYVKLLVEGDDYSKDDATKTITLTASGYEKVRAAMGGGSEEEESGSSTGGNTETPETPETPVVTNNFNGKTFLGMTGEGEDAYFVSYIIFTSDKDCEVMFFDEEPMPATYTVADDVATLTGTGEYAVIQLSTTKLTDGKFSIIIPPAVSKEEEDIVVSYEVGTLWTILYDIPDSDEDFSWKMPEEELEAAVENFGFEEDDYTKDDATKTITLTASGYAKVQALIGGGSEG